MVMLKGTGAYKDVHLAVIAYDTSVTKSGNQYFDVQVDHRDPRVVNQSNLHLVTNHSEYPAGSGKFKSDNGAKYFRSQIAAITGAAGDNKVPLRDKDGTELGTIYFITASLTNHYAEARDAEGNKKLDGLMINTPLPIKSSDYPLDPNFQENQALFMKASAAHIAAQRAAEVQVAPEQGLAQEAVIEAPVQSTSYESEPAFA